MSLILNRAQFRDAIRRKLQITPAVDAGVGAVGDPPPTRPNPSNAVMNDAINDAIAEINRYCEFHTSTETITTTATAATSLDPYSISLMDASSTLYAATSAPSGSLGAAGQVNDVRQCVWYDASGTPYKLMPTLREDLNRREVPVDNTPPGTPMYYFLRYPSLLLYPAPSTAGTVRLLIGTGVYGFLTDADTVDGLPADYQVAIQDIAVVLLSKLATMDAEAQARAQNFQGLADRQLQDIYRWSRRVNKEYQPALIFQTYRQGVGTRRYRR